MDQTKARPKSAGKNPNPPTQADPRVLDFVAARERLAYVRAADALPGGRKSLGRASWRARNAAKGSHTPALSSLRDLTAKSAAVAAELVASGCDDEAHLIALALEPLLPVLLELDARHPMPSVWTLHRDETRTQGVADDAMTTYATTGTEADRDAAQRAIMAHAVAALRLWARLDVDGARVALGQPERASRLPEALRRMVAAVRGDGPRSA